ncbi:HIT domain-containing protein [Marinobacter sp. SS21]|uniref:HIT domain-containing protein n=1 Tax=Marinobacter sp. SS21 TaxID=2979460 RepID=UPI00232CF06B|nr:HIT family protein [Marinobacter sp. SS21]MDC0661991.1 HIT family protein [Marinobacter sp. SS21]
MTADFRLHEQLSADTITLGTSALCDIRLMNDATWPWVLLVPRRLGVREIYELGAADQAQLWRESSALGEGMMRVFGGDKLNVAALGNMVPQLHLHHIVRYVGDPAWPAPVWGKQPAVPYEARALERRLQDLEPVLAELRRL